MRNFLQAEIYYLRKDLAFKSINAVFVLGSILLVVIIGNHGGYELSSPMQPLKLSRFILPVSISGYPDACLLFLYRRF